MESEADRDDLQLSLNNMCQWAKDWGMEFNVGKCKVMHIGFNNLKYSYKMDGVPLTVTERETDIGVIISNDLKWSKQCATAANRGKAVLNQISRVFHYRDRDIFLKLYCRYVRPHLEFCTPVWNPQGENNKSILEKVQIQAVNLISCLQGTYEEKLAVLGLQSLETRRRNSDLIQTYKVIKKIDNVQSSHWFNCASEGAMRVTRQSSNAYNIQPRRSRLEIRKQFFSQRVVQDWNSLPSEIKEAGTLRIFKKKLLRHKLDTVRDN